MNTKRFVGVVTLAAISVASPTFSQGMFGRRAKDPSAQLEKIFGKNTAFTATAHMTVTGAAEQHLQGMEFQYAVLDGKFRSEMDMTKIQASGIPPQAMETMKQMGMDRSVHITLPQQRKMYTLYPSMKAYVEMSTSETTSETEHKEPKFEETKLGSETIDGHPCTKSKLTVTEENGKQTEAVLWRAADLKDFPIQAQMTPNENTTNIIKFTNINLSKPSASLFEPPSDYKRYTSMQEFMMDNMQRMPPGGMPPRGGMPRGGDSE